MSRKPVTVAVSGALCANVYECDNHATSAVEISFFLDGKDDRIMAVPLPVCDICRKRLSNHPKFKEYP